MQHLNHMQSEELACRKTSLLLTHVLHFLFNRSISWVRS